MNDVGFLIPILDELYSRTHIPVILFDSTSMPLYPEISQTLLHEFIDVDLFSDSSAVKLIIEDMSVAYARIPFVINDNSYFLICWMLLNNLEVPQKDSIPKKWLRFLPYDSIKHHIACEYLSSFQDFITMLYCITTHHELHKEDISLLYRNASQMKEEEDDLTLRRLVQTTPEYYHWEESFFETFSNGNINELKSLLAELHAYDIESSDLNDLEAQKYKFAGFITLLTRTAIHNGASFELAFSLSDRYLRKLRSVQEETRLVLLLQEAISQFHILSSADNNPYSLNITRCIQFIDTHLYDKISLHTLAQHIHVNSSYLSALFKKETTTTITAYIQKKKIEEAQRLLLFTNKSYSEIASLLNFNSQSNFIQIFKKFNGLTPKKYQELKKKCT